MTILETPRFALPLLSVGQAHKELFHNDALSLLDFLMHPVVQAVVDDPSSLSPEDGDCWLAGPAAVAEWSDRADHIAGWSAGGWHFIKPQESMKIILQSDHSSAIYSGGTWLFLEQVDVPSGGMMIDLEARSAIDSILAVLRTAQILPEIN